MTEIPDTSAPRTGRKPPTRATLIMMTSISVLTLNLFLPSLPAMAEDLQVSYGTVSWAIAGYLFLSAFLTLVLGPISDRYGRRPILLGCFAVFTLASVGAALSQSFTVFLMFRMMQAVSAAGSSLSRAIVRDIFPPGRGRSVLGYIAMAMAVVPMIGPLLGGFLEEVFGWRSVFWTFAMLGVIGGAVLWFDLGETAPGRGKSFASHVQGYREVLRSGAFWGYSAVMGFGISAFFVFLAGAPLIASQHYGLEPSRVGIVIGSTAVGYFFGSFASGRISEQVSNEMMVLWGRIIAVLGPLAAVILVLTGTDTVWLVFGLMVTIGIGNGLSLPGASVGVMSVRPDLAGSAAGLSGAIGTGMGAVFSAIAGALIQYEGAALIYVSLLLFTSGAAVVCSVYVLRLERRL